MITMICGVPGAGKSSLMAYYATQLLQDDLSHYISCKRELRKLNASGFNYAPSPSPLLIPLAPTFYPLLELHDTKTRHPP